MNVTILGAGSWGTALSIVLAHNGHRVTLIGRNRDELAAMVDTRQNAHYLPGFDIPNSVQFADFDHEPRNVQMTVVAVPSSAVRQIIGSVLGVHPLVVVASKGLDTGTGKSMCEVVAEILTDAEVGVLSGPNLAVEIARGIPTLAVAAFRRQEARDIVRAAFNSKAFRISTGDDVIGVELAGALKNVLAIGAGMSDGLGFGDNTKGAFLARGLMEMARLGVVLGARLETFLGPAGVGDLFATAASRLSRNYRLGQALGVGRTLDSALAELGQVAEGVPTSHAATLLALRHNVDMPIFAAVAAVLSGRVQPLQAVGMLMERASSMADFL